MGIPAEKIESVARFAAYLEIERETGIKHEYHAGTIVAMAGGTPVHSAVAGTILGELHIQLRGKPCQPHGSDFRIRAEGSAFYPDVMVVCPPPKLDPELPNTLLNPRVIVEVLSPSTESYDRSFKWFHYQQIPELEDFILVSTDTRTVEHYHRQDDSSWLYQKLGEGDILELISIECSLPVATCFSRVELWEAPKVLSE